LRRCHEPLQHGQRIFRLRPVGVIGVDIGMPDDSITINYQGGRNGQCPAVIAIVFGDVQAELLVNGDEIVGHLIFKTIAGGDDIAGITENVDGDSLLFGDGCIVFGKLRRDQDQCAASRSKPIGKNG
jgi:hypothetical protein